MKAISLEVLKYLKNLLFPDTTLTREQRFNIAIFWNIFIIRAFLTEPDGYLDYIFSLLVMALGAWVITKLTFKPLKSLYLRIRKK
jgi:hypothetical protein